MAPVPFVTRRLPAIAIVLAAAVVWVQPASALVCANEWESDTFAGARQAVEHPGRWDGLVVGTITAVERKDDYWRTTVLVVKPGVVFSGDVRETARLEIGGHGPSMGFTEGATYFLALERSSDPSTTSWFVHPCGPNMEMTSADQLAELRTISDSEIVLSEPVITSAPTLLWIAVAAALIAIVGVWLTRRARPLLPTAG